MEQYIQEAVTRSDLNKEDESAIKKQRSFSDAVASEDNDNPSSGFDCNICLDFVQDPVVTLCGHLYCWPCIYKWLHFQSLPSENEQQPQCPVCKAEVSSTTLVPLYGRGGQSTKSSETKAPPPSLGPVIPQRPSGPAFCETLSSSASSRQNQQHLHRQYSHQPQPYHPYLGNYTASGGATTTSAFNPVIGTVGEMVYARVFGNSVTNIYHFPNSYYLADINNPRVRRQIMQADKSLSRICFFLCCSIILCLLLF